MSQDATGMWGVPPTPASEAAGSLGPGELPQTRSVPRIEDEPWRAAAAGTRARAPELATGQIVDTVA
jgi:hypothetical protein